MVLLLESKLASFYQLFRLGVYGNETIWPEWNANHLLSNY